MSRYSKELLDLAREVLSESERHSLLELCATRPLDFTRLARFDQELGGPSISTINHGSSGRYHVADRDIFRPLQYVATNFENGCRQGDLAWRTREIVLRSSDHIESLVKRIGGVGRLPLGQALRASLAKHRIDPTTWSQTDRFTKIYNASKHEFDHPKDAHLFSVQDALLAYFVCRRLAVRLYPLASLTTDLADFDASDV